MPAVDTGGIFLYAHPVLSAGLLYKLAARPGSNSRFVSADLGLSLVYSHIFWWEIDS